MVAAPGLFGFLLDLFPPLNNVPSEGIGSKTETGFERETIREVRELPKRREGRRWLC